MSFDDAVKRAVRIREQYHQLERANHGTEWTVEEDALAFLTDAGMVGRLAMAQQVRWPAGENAEAELEHKLGECIWWLIVSAERMDIDIGESLDQFLTKTEKLL